MDTALLSSDEILSLNGNQWNKGPELPYAIYASAMVEVPDYGVLLVGGSSTVTEGLETILKLNDAESKWTELPQKLKAGRNLHSAFLVPDKLADCL